MGTGGTRVDDEKAVYSLANRPKRYPFSAVLQNYESAINLCQGPRKEEANKEGEEGRGGGINGMFEKGTAQQSGTSGWSR